LAVGRRDQLEADRLHGGDQCFDRHHVALELDAHLLGGEIDVGVGDPGQLG